MDVPGGRLECLSVLSGGAAYDLAVDEEFEGVLDTKDVIYYVNFTAMALFFTLRSLEARRWAG